MGQCSCGHEHSNKFCPECGKASGNSSEPSGQSNDLPEGEGRSQNDPVSDRRTSVSNSSDEDEEEPKASDSTGQVRRRSGPRVVKVTTKKDAPAKTQSVSTRKIVKKPLPSKTGRAKNPTVRTRVVANIEKKQANEERDKKSASGNSMRDKIRHASGWRWM